MEDLWPDFKEIAPDKTPISIIKEHASNLYEKTNYMVLAEVEKVENLDRIQLYDKGKYLRAISPPFQYNFYLEARALNYRYKLFQIAHDIYLYPIYFYEIDKDIFNELYPDQQGATTINNEIDLLVFLKNIFKAKKTMKIIQALISQVS